MRGPAVAVRVAPRVYLAPVVFGARMMQLLIDGDPRLRKWMLVVAAIALALAPIGMNWPMTLARAGALALLLLLLPRLPKIMVPLLLAAFVLLDLAPLLVRLAPRMPASYYTTAPAAASRFPRERDSFRVYNLGAGEARHHVIRDAEDHHRDETDHVHVCVCRPVDDPCRMDRHREAKCDAGSKPHQARSDKCFDEPVHAR